MFVEYESSGKHMICDFKHIKNSLLLNNYYELDLLLKKICEDNDFQIIGQTRYKFEPIGCSIIFLLSESHISIHTFPEKNHMSFDIYTCRQYKDNKAYEDIYKFLIDKLNASSDNSVCKIIDRFF
jgi:S-adenosylmethionine decarboxylase proenzyme